MPIVHHQGLASASFNADASKLVTCGAEGSAKVWSLTRTSPNRLVQHEESNSFQYSEMAGYSLDGRQLVAVSFGKCYLFDADHIFEPPVKLESNVGLRMAQFTRADTRIVAAGGHNTSSIPLHAWDAVSKQPLEPLRELRFADQPTSMFTDLVVDPRGRWAAVAEYNSRTVSIWDLDRSEIEPQTQWTFELAPVTLATSPNGRTLAIGFAGAVDGQPRSVELRDLDSDARKVLNDTPPISSGGHASQRHLAFDPSGNRLAIGGGNRFGPRGDFTGTSGTLEVWDCTSGHRIAGPASQPSAVCSIAFNGDGQKLALGCVDGTARVVNSETLTPLASKMRQNGEINALRFDETNRLLALASGDPPPSWRGGEARLWDVSTGQPVCDLWSYSGVATSIDIRPGGGQIVVGGDFGLALHEIATDWKSTRALVAVARLLADAKIDDSGSLVPLSNDDWRQEREHFIGPKR